MLFNKLRRKYIKRRIIIDDNLHCKFEEYGAFDNLKLDEELFKLITWVEVFDVGGGCDYYLD